MHRYVSGDRARSDYQSSVIAKESTACSDCLIVSQNAVGERHGATITVEGYAAIRNAPAELCLVPCYHAIDERHTAAVVENRPPIPTNVPTSEGHLLDSETANRPDMQEAEKGSLRPCFESGDVGPDSSDGQSARDRR